MIQAEHGSLLAFLDNHTHLLIQDMGSLLLIIWLGLWLVMFLFGKPFCQRLKNHLQQLFVHSKTSIWLIPFPILSWLIEQRLNPNRLSGLPTTLLLIAIVMIATLLAGLIEDIVNTETVVMIDQWFSHGIAQMRTEQVSHLFSTITLLGNPEVVLPLWGATLMILWVRKQHWIAAAIFVSFSGSLLTAGLAKWAFQRPRPDHALWLEHSFSLPSGHATLAMAFYGVLFYLWWRQQTRWRNQVGVAFIGSSFVLGLGISRLIVGVHYMSDVLAGFLLGSIWLLIAVSLIEWSHHSLHAKRESP